MIVASFLGAWLAQFLLPRFAVNGRHHAVLCEVGMTTWIRLLISVTARKALRLIVRGLSTCLLSFRAQQHRSTTPSQPSTEYVHGGALIVASVGLRVSLAREVPWLG